MRNIILTSVFWFSALALFSQTTFQKIIPRPDSGYLQSVIQTSDGGFAAMGNEGTNNEDKWLVRTDSNGDTLWTKTYPGTGLHYAGDRLLIATTDGGFSFLLTRAGTTFLTRVDATGDSLWNRELFSGCGRAISRTPGGYVIVGDGRDTANNSLVIVCNVSDNGDIIWKKTYLFFSIHTAAWPYPKAIRKMHLGGYIVAGNILSGYGDYIPFMFGIGPTGDSIWYKLYSLGSASVLHAVDTTADGGLIACGGVNSYSAAFIMKTNSTGDTLWTQKLYPVPGYHYFSSILSTKDGGTVACGGASNGFYVYDTINVYLVKFSANGDVDWKREFRTAGNCDGYCIERTADNGYVICGEFYPYGSSEGQSGILIKTDANGNFSGILEKVAVSTCKVFPNPASDHVTFHLSERTNLPRTISVHNLVGREICRRLFPKGETELTITTKDWRPGLYLYSISGENSTVSGKISISPK